MSHNSIEHYQLTFNWGPFNYGDKFITALGKVYRVKLCYLYTAQEQTFYCSTSNLQSDISLTESHVAPPSSEFFIIRSS